MYRFLLTPRWLAGLALALALSAVCVLLGTWQWDRREQARARIAPVVANYDREPVPIHDVLPSRGDAGPLPRAAEWTPVIMHGTYSPEDSLLLRNRSLQGRPGYHVLVPLQLDDGRAVVVDRGWLPTGATGQGPDSVPSVPAGEVQVLGRLRAPEPAFDRDAPAGQVHTVDLERLADVLDRQDLVVSAYAVLDAERPAPAEAPVALPRPVPDEGPHLSYSLQWFVFAIGVLVAYGVLARRTAHEQRSPAGGKADTGRAGPRRRPTSEQEEDALLDAAEQRGAG